MVTTIYQPGDTRFSDIFEALSPGIQAVGQYYGKKQRAKERAAALTELLSKPGQTQEALLTQVMSSEAFADDPTAAMQLVQAMSAARKEDRAKGQAKALLGMAKDANPGVFDKIDPAEIESLDADQLSAFVNTVLDAEAQKRQEALTVRGQDIQQQLGLEGIQVQREGIQQQAASSAASAQAQAAALAEQRRQFDIGHELDVLKTQADLRQTDAQIAATAAQTRLATLEADIKAATTEDQKAKLKAEVDSINSDISYRNALAEEARVKAALAIATAPAEQEKAKAELEKVQAEIKKMEAEAANAPLEAEKTRAETEKNKAEAAKAAAEAKSGAGKEFEVAGQATAERLQVPQHIAVRINQVEPQTLNMAVAQYKGVYDSATQTFSFTDKATPEDKAKANIAAALVGQSLAGSKGDPGAAVQRAVGGAEEVYAALSEALQTGTDEENFAAAQRAVGQLGYTLTPRDLGYMLDAVDAALGAQ